MEFHQGLLGWQELPIPWPSEVLEICWILGSPHAKNFDCTIYRFIDCIFPHKPWAFGGTAIWMETPIWPIETHPSGITTHTTDFAEHQSVTRNLPAVTWARKRPNTTSTCGVPNRLRKNTWNTVICSGVGVLSRRSMVKISSNTTSTSQLEYEITN